MDLREENEVDTYKYELWVYVYKDYLEDMYNILCKYDTSKSFDSFCRFIYSVSSGIIIPT